MIPNDVKEALTIYLDAYEYRDKDWGGSHPHLRRAYETLCAFRDNLPQPPEPDWSQAPDWAQWWAVDADGTAVWYEAEPFVSDPFMWDWNYTPHTQNKIDKILHIPIGIDWRTTLRRRPQPEQPHD